MTLMVSALMEKPQLYQEGNDQMTAEGLKIGVNAPLFLDKIKEIGIYETLRKVKEIGFNVIELSQVTMTPENVAELCRACKDFKIEVASMTAAIEPMVAPEIEHIDNLTEDFDKIIEDCKILSCYELRIVLSPLDCLFEKGKLLEYVKKCDDMARKLKARGIGYSYHHHHWELHRLDPKTRETCLDVMINNSTDLGFELDTYWLWAGCVDPLKMIPRLKGRINVFHLKDYRVGKMNAEDFYSGDSERLRQAHNRIPEFAEIGEGALDMRAIIECAWENGTKYAFIEQDLHYGRDSFECIRISHDNLVKMGFGHCL